MRRFVTIFSCVCVLATVCLVGWGCGQAFSEQREDAVRGVPLAEVNGEAIMSETFREGYVGYLLKTGLQDKPQYRQHFLNSQVASLLLVQEARGAGIESREAYQEAHARIRKKLLVDIYVRKALFDEIEVSEDDLKDMFVRANTILTARHLYAPTKENADALYRRLEEGATFDVLAMEVFSDTTLANNGGLIGEFTVDDMDVAFEEAAYQLGVGEVSEPVQTAQGYSIIKLEDRFTRPLITEYEYAESKDRMLQFVLYRKKTKARKEHAARLLEDVSPVYNSAAFDRLYDLVAGNTTVQNSEALDAWIDEPLVSFSSADGIVAWTTRDFQGMASETSDEQRARVRTEEDLKSFIDALIVREEMAVRSRMQRLDEDPEFTYEIDKAMHHWIWGEAVDDLKQGAAVSPDSLEAYYQANRGNFVPEPEVEIHEILVDSKDLALNVEEQLKTRSFESVARTYSKRPGAAEHGGRLGYLRPSQLGVLWDRVSGAKEGELLGPIELEGHFVFLKIGERTTYTPGREHPGIDEIKAQYFITHGDRLVSNHVDALKKASDITIHDSLLSSLEINKPYSLPDNQRIK